MANGRMEYRPAPPDLLGLDRAWSLYKDLPRGRRELSALGEVLTTPFRAIEEAYPERKEVEQWIEDQPPHRLGPIGEAVISGGDEALRFLGGVLPTTGSALEEELLMSLLPIGRFKKLDPHDLELSKWEKEFSDAMKESKDAFQSISPHMRKPEGGEVIDEVLGEAKSSGSGFKLVEGPEPPQITYDDLTPTQKQFYDNLSDKQKAQYSPSDINAMDSKPTSQADESFKKDMGEQLKEVTSQYGDGSQYKTKADELADLPRQLDLAEEELYYLYPEAKNMQSPLAEEPLSYSQRGDIEFTPKQEEIWDKIPYQLKNQLTNAWEFFDEFPGDVSLDNITFIQFAKRLKDLFPDLSYGAINAITYKAYNPKPVPYPYGSLGNFKVGGVD